MNETEKKRICALRAEGMGYASIASALGVTKSQVSGYCRRAGIGKGEQRDQRGVCPNCGGAVEQARGRKPRRFCCGECRQAWWNAHPERVARRAVYEFDCAGCGKRFTAYGNSHRKYCSHACYIADRYGTERRHG